MTRGGAGQGDDPAPQLEAADQAIAETIDGDPEWCAKRAPLVSISGVGETLARSWWQRRGGLIDRVSGPDAGSA